MHLLRAGRLAACLLAAATLLTACSSANNNKPNTATITGTKPPAAGTATANSSTGSSPASGTPRPGAALTPLPGASGSTGAAASPVANVTPSPQLQTAIDTLTPLFIGTGDLPQPLQAWTYTKPFAFENCLYVHGRPNADALCQQLDKAGRLGTLSATWGNGAGQQATLQTHAETALNDILALYQSADAAASGCPFVFQDVQPQVQAPNGDVTTTTPLAIGAVGHEFKAYHVDYRYNAAGAGGGSNAARLQQVYLTACWRRGDVVATVQLSALNDEPSVAEFQQVIAAQDKKLTSAGLQ
ncbi:MAG TPA: hypothetical protein VFD32_00955 [Dehalococcoidia bacterium]|nr:hypothetical protein [Dehalococcoidia bacterium]